MTLRVNIEDLAASGVAVTGHGETMASAHSCADGRIDSAQAGWQGTSATALAGKLAAWSKTTSTLLTRMSDHAQGLHTGAHEYAQSETQGARVMQDVAADGDAAASATKR